MKTLLTFALVGFLAQLIDGSLGMGYGLSSSTLLLTFGVAPAVASATIHLAEIATTAASGISHWKFGNVEWRTLYLLTIPGAAGAFLGASFLSQVSGAAVKPYISLFLLGLGLYIVCKSFTRRNIQPRSLTKGKSILLGLFAGFADSTGGGGWGAIATPVLLSASHDPRKAIGTVSASEFAVSVAASLGFLASLNWNVLNGYWILTLMGSGIVAAPLAAFLVRKLPAKILGPLTGICIILLNMHILLRA
ncbi:sulfite exporter TauE/SafE family protein [Ectobacillus ponti]|uniref:Probable membrane transporter protein n=1 Tax=Ectobacillus ponti TaxID=2961894 RepID=A0AA42BQD1_9BACI|nr:sulfite exporter TauE/SafE family protein [Ectobacillus ponti]MCP8968334.1 sulfite exporter TauE/SafE family protein [Ectobacillus ponti]